MCDKLILLVLARCDAVCADGEQHKTIGLLKTGNTVSGSPLAGQVVSSSNVDFYVEKGVVHIADTRVAPTFVHYFTKHIDKLEAQCADLTGQPRAS